MNAAISIGIHSNIEALIEKTQGDLSRVSEFLLINKASKKFDKTYIFTSDNKKYQKGLPENCIHVPLGGRFFFLFFSWIVVLRYVIRNQIQIIFVEGSTALPSVFFTNKITNVKTMLNYNYLWHLSYALDTRKSLMLKIRKNKINSYFIKMIEKIMIRFIDYFLVASEEIRIFVNKKENIVNIKKGILLSKFDSRKIKRHPIFKKIDGPTIVFAARLVPLKDPITLIKAYYIAKKKIPKLNLIMCGDGELLEDCKKVADKDVQILGFVKDLPSILRGADVFVLASIYDGSPRSLLEAMSMGIACITTKVGGIPNYIDESCGVFVKPRNPEDLAEKIVFLIENKSKSIKMGERARERMIKYHNLDKNLDKAIRFMSEKSKYTI